MAKKNGATESRRSLLCSVTRRFGAWPLFGVILLWVALALVVFTVLGWVWGEGAFLSGRWLTNWRSAGADTSPLDVVRVSLTTIGGIGGTGYLVIRYRERASAERAEKMAELARKDVEQEKAEQKLLNAVQQLGSESPQVRIAGVYSLADVADTYRGDYRQRVVNILCGYLRTPRGTWETVADTNASMDESATRKVYVSHDGAVESTVLEVLTGHLRKRRASSSSSREVAQEVEDDQLWCDCTIDLHGAVIRERFDFSGTALGADVNAQGAQFLGDVNFRDASFSCRVDFSCTTFRKYADFRSAAFDCPSDLQQARFVSNADFRDSTFRQKCKFKKAAINKASFDRARFQGAAELDQVRFEQVADYVRSEFTVAEFRKSVFSNGAQFSHALFRQHAKFEDARFQGDTTTSFDGAIVQCATFEGTRFESPPCFKNASFSKDFIEYKEYKESVFSFPPEMAVEEETGLPPGAAWARFDADGRVREAVSPEPDTGTDEPGDGDDPGT